MRPGTVPVRLPEILVQLDDGDTATISGPTDDSKRRVSRAVIGGVLADAADRAGSAVRVELLEPDGTRHVDILTPPAPAPDGHDHVAASAARRPGHRRVEVIRDGFVPGETVLVAPATRTTRAEETGRVAVRLHRRVTRQALGGVLVYGTASGCLVLVEPS